MSDNPLIKESQLKFGAVEFDKISVEHFIPALKTSIELAKTNIAKIKAVESPSFENVIEALELADQKLGNVVGRYYNLFSAEASDNLQALAPEISSLTSTYNSDVQLDQELFSKIKYVFENERDSLEGEKKVLLEKTYKTFVRNGANLAEDDKNKLRELDQDLAQISPKYSENVLKETNAFQLLLETESDIAGLPEQTLLSARALAEEFGIKKKRAWLITLDAPSFIPFLKFSSNRALREKVWFAFASRCTEGQFSNKENVKNIVRLRQERAKILGYENHSSYVLEERMAKKPSTVFSFLDKLVDASAAAARKDVKDLEAFSQKLDGFSDLRPWDISYYSEKLLNERFDFDPELLRPYLSVDKCIQGAFSLASELYDIEFIENKELPKYHKDVQVYEVYGKSDNEYIGLFYADFFPRASKRGGAWMTSFKEQGFNGKNVERPHVSIVCNFTKPTKTHPSLLDFRELETLFHEFGHSLHGLLSKCHYKSLGGTNVHWDFVELPSQFMENWLLEKEVLDKFASHYKTDEKIPAEYIEKLQKSSKFQAGYTSLRQLNFGTLDMAWHTESKPIDMDVEEFENQATIKTTVIEKPAGAVASTTFSHIFSGGYSAGYYSYKWAEVLDADAFEHFKKNGLFNKEIAKSFKETILEMGGSVEPDELYRKFRGEDPDPNALLRRDGLI